MTKEEMPITPTQQEGTLAIVSLVLGIVSLTGPGLLLGIPAIITGAIALKKNQNRGLSIAGLVTGIVSTLVSLLFIVLFVVLAIYGFSQDGNSDRQPYQPDRQVHSSRI
jgi:O-antigen/teichoic acid export membrane protein